MGIEDLRPYDSSGDPEQTQYAHRRDYEGQPINAVLVRRWTNRPPKGEGTGYLTNAAGSDPLVVFDTYGWRSVIEHGIFKEGKYPWPLGTFPKQTAAAVMVPCHFTLLVMGLCTALRLWQAQQSTRPTQSSAAEPGVSTTLLGGEGTARWPLRLCLSRRKIGTKSSSLWGRPMASSTWLN